MFDNIDRVATGYVRNRIRDILGAFMFGGEASEKKVKVLSGGEKTRLAMIKLLLEPVNFLILDEPTNHLDMKTKDILKDAINDFDGTVIVVSHDREFLDGLVEKVYEFGGGKVKENLGGIYDFLRKKKLDNLNELERSTPSLSSLSPQSGNEADNGLHSSEREMSGKNLSYAEQKERDKIIRKAEKAAKEAENRVSELETKISDIEHKLAEGDASPEVLEEYSGVSTLLEESMALWESAQMELDSLKEKFR